MPTTPDDSVRLATSAVADAGRRGAAVICFPECFVPGYRWLGQEAPSPDPVFLERAWAASATADVARRTESSGVVGMRMFARAMRTLLMRVLLSEPLKTAEPLRSVLAA
jgi:predicted amidohydrolase